MTDEQSESTAAEGVSNGSGAADDPESDDGVAAAEGSAGVGDEETEADTATDENVVANAEVQPDTVGNEEVVANGEAETDTGRVGGAREELRDAAERVGETASAAADGFDQRLVDLLSWVLDTETRARIYAFLRQSPASTSDEIADGTGLYPSTVREALAELHDDGFVTRGKRTSTGAGNNPYEYEAIPPSELVDSVVDDVQSGLNTVFNLDERLGRRRVDSRREPVNVTVETPPEDDGDASVDSSSDSTVDSDSDSTVDSDSDSTVDSDSDSSADSDSDSSVDTDSSNT